MSGQHLLDRAGRKRGSVETFVAMICLEDEHFCFNYRVGGIAVRPSDGYVLLHRAAPDAFWAPPGGRCERDEEAPFALAREMREEIGVAVDVGRLLFVIEVFFSHGQRRCQELGLYFSMKFPDERVYAHEGDFCGCEPGIPLIYRWVPPPSPADPDAPVAGFPILPVCLRGALANPLPETVQHRIGRENAPPKHGAIEL
jgi:8-oxo-dGTP pyrophosphatase MutT (NUDIX family)